MSIRFAETGALALDTNNLGAVTSTFDVPNGALHKMVFAVSITGTHGTHVIELQGSPNGGTDWFDMGTINGSGLIMDHICLCPQLRVKVTTAEGGTSTCEIFIFAS